MGNPRVLVIDALPETQAVLATTLAGEGYDVVTAGDSLSGRRLMARESFAFILLGLRAGEEEDIETLRKLAAWSAGEGVIVTARGASKELVKALSLGVLGDPEHPAAAREEEAAFADRLARARSSLEANKLEQAMAYISQAVVVRADRPEIFNLIGAIMELRGDIDAARRMYRVAVTIEPAYGPARQNLERTCGWRYDAAGINLGDWPEAGTHSRQ